MLGVVTRDRSALPVNGFEPVFYEAKDVTGRRDQPVDTAVNMVSCHGDSAATDDDDLVSIDADGNRATRDRPYFDWGYVCPTHERYRSELLAFIERCCETNPPLRLDDVGFARPEFCHCRRCEAAFERSEFDDRFDWRGDVIERFLADATDRIDGRVYLTLYPDPYTDHLYRRAGIDLQVLEEYVDEVVIPLYDMAYTTTYWLEIIATGFSDVLTIPFSVEVYGIDVDIDNLLHAVEVADAYAKDVYIAYDMSTAEEIRQRYAAM